MINVDFKNINYIELKDYNSLKSKRYYNNLSPLKSDIVSFGALKKSQFSGIDLLVVNKFKAPIEKFHNNEDFQNWCKEKVNNILKKDYKGKYKETEMQRNDIIDDWIIYLSNYKYSIHLLALSGISEDLNSKNNKLPPPFDVIVLSETLKEIENYMNNNPKYDVNFLKLYQKNLRSYVLKSCANDLDDTKTGWIKIPSYKHDYKNFDANLLKLKLLSSPTWCISGSTADIRLGCSDFHIYYENGIPKVAMNIINDEVEEIEGIKNNLRIPVKYLDIIKDHIKDMYLSDCTKNEIEFAQKKKENIDIFLKKHFPNGTENASNEEIFNAVGIKTEKDKDSFLTISEYHQPFENITFEDIGVDENKLMNKVIKIKADADFENSELTSLANIQLIEGNAKFKGSKIRNLGKLKTVKGKCLISEMQKELAELLRLRNLSFDFIVK